MEKTLTISQRTAICAARHIVVAHKSDMTEKPVEIGVPCIECSERPECRFNWYGTMKPIFEAAGIYPQFFCNLASNLTAD